jgi:hypothetical protein
VFGLIIPFEQSRFFPKIGWVLLRIQKIYARLLKYEDK